MCIYFKINFLYKISLLDKNQVFEVKLEKWSDLTL